MRLRLVAYGRQTMSAVAFLAVTIFCGVVCCCHTAWAAATDAWDKPSPVTVVDSNQTLNYQDFDKMRRSYMGVHGRQACTNSVVVTSPTSGGLPSCWYSSLIGDLSDYGNAIKPAFHQYAGFLGESAQKRLIATPTKDTFLELTPQDSGGFRVDVRSLTDVQLEELIIQDDGTMFYDFSQAPSATLRNSFGDLFLVDDNNVAIDMWYSANGKYLLVAKQDSGTVSRINLDTYKILTTKYTLDTDGDDSFASFDVTNDGQYIIVNVFGHSPRIINMKSCSSNEQAYVSEPSVCGQRIIGSVIDNFDPATGGMGDFAIFEDDTKIAFYTSVGQEDYSKFYIFAPGTWQPGNKYIALGDSFASGEGAGDYYAGTDIEKTNMCHLSRNSYPYLLADHLSLDTSHSVACSGAKIKNVVGDLQDDGTYRTDLANQYDPNSIDGDLREWTSGYQAQLSYFKYGKPDIVTVSIGGNDMGFGKIIASCVDPRQPPTCFQSPQDKAALLNTINAQYTRLIDTYKQIKQNAALGARVYVIGYPKTVKADGDCGVNVLMNAQETEFAENIVDYINLVVRRAADRAGVTYVDVSEAFDGYRLCESGEPAVHGATFVMSWPRKFKSSESYHPTKWGHELLASKIEYATDNFEKVNPRPDFHVRAPDILDALAFGFFHDTQEAVNAGFLYFDTGLDSSVVTKSATINGNYDNEDANLLTDSSNYESQLHSDPVDLGTAYTDSQGVLHYSLKIPEDTPTGFHTITFTGKNKNGEDVKIQASIYVAASDDDWDGDGIPNDMQTCPYTVPDPVTGQPVRDWCVGPDASSYTPTRLYQAGQSLDSSDLSLAGSKAEQPTLSSPSNGLLDTIDNKKIDEPLSSGLNDSVNISFVDGAKRIWPMWLVILSIVLVLSSIHLVHYIRNKRKP